MTNENDQEKKIIIDEDWKTQVQAEKDAAKAKEAAGGESTPETDNGSDADAPLEVPPASFELLVTTLATQAMAALGQFPMPDGEELPIRLPMASHYIDTLEVLKEKTKGNLSKSEEDLLETALHQLRMLYVAVEKNMPTSD